MLTDIRSELIKELTPVARQHTRQRNVIVARWAHRPRFKSEIKVTSKQVALNVMITNATESLGKYGGTIADLWKWHNEGTKPHIITPRFASILRFVIDNRVIFTNLVKHPGTKAQKYNERINKRLNRQLINAIQRGYRRGFKRAFR